MQGFRHIKGSIRKRFVAGLLAVMAMVIFAPAAAATSIVAQAEPEEEEQSPAASPYRGLSHDQIRFLEDNWHFTIDDLVEEEVEQGRTLDDPQALRNEIQFLEDNWYFAAEDLGLAEEEPVAENLPMTRGEMYFIEQNIEFGLSASDQVDESDDDEDDDDSDDDNDVSYPWPEGPTEFDY